MPADQLVTSFSSKSEGALNLSTDKKYLTFIDYVAQVGQVDVSNGNTPGVVDPSNPVGGNFYRAVAKVDQDGHFDFTETNAYSGNNGRAAIYNCVRERLLHSGQCRQRQQSATGWNTAGGPECKIMTPANESRRKTEPWNACSGGQLQHHRDPSQQSG